MTEQPHVTSMSEDFPTLVALHFLGGSAGEWTPLFGHLSGRFRFAPIDLPGFGSAAHLDGYDVAAMAGHVAAQIRRLAPRRWILVGHSMGAKVACAVARMAEDGDDGLQGLTHLVFIAGSPPGPEPMDEAKRQTMRSWFAGGDAERRRQADSYIRDNVDLALAADRHAAAVDAVLLAHRPAWLAWLDGGSREDWTARIGTLRTPALVVAGTGDTALGMTVQKDLAGPHLASVRWHSVPDAGHLLPLECPEALAACMLPFLNMPTSKEPALPAAYRALIDSPRVNARTRGVLLDRAEPVDRDPDVLTADEMTVLRAVVARVIPQQGDAEIDIAARLDRRLATGAQDGWRFSDLPADAVAMHAGLRSLDAIAQTLDAANFASLMADQQDALLTGLVKGSLSSPIPAAEGGLTAQQLTLWFEDIRSAAVQVYVSHPVTQARLGYSGIANRGDGTGGQGFRQVGLGQREPWEPEALAVTPR